MTFRTRLARTFVHNVMAVAVLLTIGVAGVATQENLAVERPMVQGSSSTAFDCEPVPPGKFPSSAVVRKVGGGTKQVTRPALVSKAFDTAIGVRAWAGVNGIELCR